MFPQPYGDRRGVCNLSSSAAAQYGTARAHAARRSVSVARSCLAHTVKLFTAGGAPPRPHVVSSLIGQERLAGAGAPVCCHSRRQSLRFRLSHSHRRTRKRPAPVDSYIAIPGSRGVAALSAAAQPFLLAHQRLIDICICLALPPKPGSPNLHARTHTRNPPRRDKPPNLPRRSPPLHLPSVS